ncbi:MAG: lectin MOA-related protein [Enterobacteriaceae bacterium]|jgi:hypothetical protein|nr:lectin MOA-related protein [Enterobacteriaceae bacterium]
MKKNNEHNNRKYGYIASNISKRSLSSAIRQDKYDRTMQETDGKTVPLHHTIIHTGVTYKVYDELKNVLCKNKIKRPLKRPLIIKENIFLAHEEDYKNDIVLIQFGPFTHPVETNKALAHMFYLDDNGSAHYLRAYNNNSSLNERLYFTEDKNTAILMRVEHDKESEEDEQFTIIWDNKYNGDYPGTDMFWQREERHDWSWVYAGPQDLHHISFSFHPIYFNAYFIKDILNDIFDIPETNIEVSNSDYIPVDDDIATKIFNNSELKNYNYNIRNFDSDDFGLVYKAQECKDAYQSNLNRRYAIGIMYGKNKDGIGQVSNIFINGNLEIKILNPQNGGIHYLKDWQYNIPYMILF